MSEHTFLVTFVKYEADALMDNDGSEDRIELIYTDHYEVFEHLPDAHRRYEALCKEDDTWSANVSRVIRSTDYHLPVHEVAIEHRPALQQKYKERGIRSPNQKLMLKFENWSALCRISEAMTKLRNLWSAS